MNTIPSLFGPTRPAFLILTPACVLLGIGTAISATHSVNWPHVVLALLAALCAHISVNAFNEYFDFKSGLDLKTQPTPFSGGSGTLPAHPELARPALFMAWVSFTITGLIGMYFIYLRGFALAPIGLLGLLILFAYTPWLTRNPLLCLIAPGLGFGPLMVLSTHLALAGFYTPTALLASLVPFFLVSNLLLLNQFPDVEADRSIGRKHLPIVIGRRASSLVYGSFLLLAYLTIVAGVLTGLLPPVSLMGLLTAVLAIPAGIKAFRHAEEIEKLLPAMGWNVLINLVTPVLVSIGLFIR
ncbi:MAG: prenyltransferase [Chloroflexota bacterium]